MKAIFLRVLAADDKATALRQAIHGVMDQKPQRRFDIECASFARVPTSPFAYWISPRLRALFSDLPRFEADGRTVRQGLATSDDFRFVRSWLEVRADYISARWFPFAKGGQFSPFYSDVSVVINWHNHGRELKAFADTTPGTTHWSRNIKSTDYYFRPALTWPLRTARFSPQVLPAGAVFSVRGYCIFAEQKDLLALLGICASRMFDHLFKVQLGRSGHPEFVVGVLQQLPFPVMDRTFAADLSAFSRQAWSAKRTRDTYHETSHAFVLPVLLTHTGANITERHNDWAARVRTLEAVVTEAQAEIDDRSFKLYGVDQDVRREVIESLDTVGASDDNIRADTTNDAEPGDSSVDDVGEIAAATSAEDLVAELLSWCVGATFGRFDVRLATGSRPLPDEPEPFDPLPVCSPGMLTGGGGLPAAAAPPGYPVAFPVDGVLVDDPGHPRDLSAAVRHVFDLVFGPQADAWRRDVVALVDPRRRDVGNWLRAEFFDFHLRRYSKSRRKSPILWQLAVPSNRYGIWLYAHRLGRDTFYQLQSDVVAPKLAHEERRLVAFTQEAGPSPVARDRKAIAEQEALVEELRAFRDEVARVAPLWNPTLDDGVLLTMAPLWRLVPQHRAWQKELKGAWDALCAGKYDWAHLAMHLWPERVVPKCAADRSLAIAHGLEEVFWAEDSAGKWKPRPAPTHAVAELVAERTSPAVKAALASLLDAPAAERGGRGARSARRAR